MSKMCREQQHDAVPMPSTLKGVLKAPNGSGIAQHAHFLLALLVQFASQSSKAEANIHKFFVFDGGPTTLLDTVFVSTRTG